MKRSMTRWKKVLLLLACCAAVAACQTQDNKSAANVDPAACKKTCDEVFDQCTQKCHVDDTICPEACVDAVGSCNKRCG